MSDTETQILDAAIAAVAFSGMRKTSVGDIADRAGVSRQTVYNLFGAKDDVYRAAIEHLGLRWRTQAQKGLESATGLSEQLDALFEVFAVEAFRFSHANPDSADMFLEAHLVAPDLMAEFFDKNRELFAQVLSPYSDQLNERGLSVTGLADQLEIACRGYKRDARSLEHLRELLVTQKSLTLAHLGL